MTSDDNPRTALGVLALALATSAAPLHALTVNGYSADANDRFVGTFPGSIAANVSAMFVGAGYDWSGVGWDAGLITRNIAMITSEYFVYATHYPPGANLQFLSPVLNTVVSYTWNPATGAINLPHPGTGQISDFSVGRLSAALDPTHGLATYPILGLPTPAYVGLPLLTYGFGSTSGPRIGEDVIAGIAELDILPPIDGIEDSWLVYHLDEGQPGQTMYEGGDSSGPLFVPWQGTLAIIGTHSGKGDVSGIPAGFDNFIPAYLDGMDVRGIPYVLVPEPAWTAGLFGLGLAAWAAGRRRRTTSRG